MRLSAWTVIALAFFLVLTLSAACNTNDDCDADQSCEGGNCVDLVCTACQDLVDHACVEKTGGICCMGFWFDGKDCCSDDECDNCKTCSDKICVNVTCNDCQECDNAHGCKAKTGGMCCDATWVTGAECCEAADCSHFLCEDNACSTTTCEEDYSLCDGECVALAAAGGSCTLDCHCQANLDCVGDEGSKKCLKANGQTCTAGTECASGVCVDGTCDTCTGQDDLTACTKEGVAEGWCCQNTCVTPLLLDGDCGGVACKCDTNLECTADGCKKEAGQTCTDSGQCASKLCAATGLCGTPATGAACLLSGNPTGSVCNEACCSNICDTGTEPDTCDTACATAGETCYETAGGQGGQQGTCCNDQCVREAERKAAGDSCTETCECQNGLACGGPEGSMTCRLAAGEPCTAWDECASIVCVQQTAGGNYVCGTCQAKDATFSCKAEGITGLCCNDQCIAPAGLDGGCTQDCHCLANFECSGTKCKRVDDQDCTTWSECASSICVDDTCGSCTGKDGIACIANGIADGRCCANTCSIPDDVGTACTADCQCVENTECSGEEGSKTCKKVNGQACTDSGQCASNLCDASGLCSTPATGSKCLLTGNPSGTVCDSACCATICDTGTEPDTCGTGCATGGATCYKTVGTQGGQEGKCCNDGCVRDVERLPSGESCSVTCQCTGGLICSGPENNKKCKKEVGGPCTVWSECASGACVQGTPGGDYTCGTCEGKDLTYACKSETATGWCCLNNCFAPLGLDEDCTDHCECEDGLQCEGNKCKKEDGEACTIWSQCASSVCVMGTAGGDYVCGGCAGKDTSFNCTADGITGWCCAGACTAPVSQDAACAQNCDCGEAFDCTDTGAGKKCKLKEGQSCTQSDDCSQKLCSLDGVCNGALVSPNQCFVDDPTKGTVCQDKCCGLPSFCMNDQCVVLCGVVGATCYEGAGTEGVCCQNECFTLDERGGLFEACNADCQCKTEYSCTGNKCLYKNGRTCSSWSQCSSGLCVSDGGTYKCGACTAGNAGAACEGDGLNGLCCDNDCRVRQGLGAACVSDCYCEETFQCTEGFCKLKETQTCEKSLDCANSICGVDPRLCNGGLTSPSQCYVQYPGTKGTACDGQCCGTPNFCFGATKACVNTCNNVWMECYEGPGIPGICCQTGCYTDDERKGLDGTCAADCQCKGDYVCTLLACKLKDDRTCSAGNQCASSVCIEMTQDSYKCGTCGAGTTKKECSAGALTGWCCGAECVEPKGLDGSCTADCHCENNFLCVGAVGNKKCKKVDGQTCTSWGQCVSGVCVDGSCGACGGSDFTTCSREGVDDGWCCGAQCVDPQGQDAQCTADCHCEVTMQCVGAEGNQLCKLKEDQTCTDSAQCSSELCDEAGKCGTPTTGSKCMLGGDPTGSVCNDVCCANICNTGTTPYTCGAGCANAGATCYETAGGQGGQQGKCCNNNCVRQAEKLPLDQACQMTCECDETAQLECTGGVCKTRSGQPCTLGSQCGTNVCVNDLCGECNQDKVSCQSGNTQGGWCCNGECVDAVPLNGVCTANCNCQGDTELTCAFGIGLCKHTGGQSCSRSTDCDSKVCAAGGASCATNPGQGDLCKVDTNIDGLVCHSECCNGYCDSDSDVCNDCGLGHACMKLVSGVKKYGSCCADQCFLTTDRKGYEKECQEHCECGANLECAVATDHLCRMAAGQGCTNGTACASGACVSGICGTCVGKSDISTGCMTPTFSGGWCCAGACVSPKETGEDCVQDCECKVGMQCAGNKCKKDDGESCTDSGQCASGICRTDSTCGPDDTGDICKIAGANIGTVCGSVCCNAICDVGLNLCSTNTCVEDHLCYENQGTQGSCCADACYTPGELLLLDAACIKSCQCQNTLACTGTGGTDKCKLKDGQTCTSGAECSSGVCVAGTCGTCAGKAITTQCKTANILDGWCCEDACVTHGALNAGCAANCQCQDQFACTGLLCKLRNGQGCIHGEDCSSSVCVNDVCGTCVGKGKTNACDTQAVANGWCCADDCVSPGELGDACTENCQCKDQFLCTGFQCKRKDGQACISGDQCASDVCVQQTAGGNYVCGTCGGKSVETQCNTGTVDDGWCCSGGCNRHKGQDEGCTVDCNCDPLYMCKDNRCKKKDNQACTTAGECAVGQCVAGTCRTCTGIVDFTSCASTTVTSGKCCNNICTGPKGLGEGCTFTCQCGANMECIGGVCKKAAGQPCTSGDQCGTGLCVGAAGESICGTCNTDDFTPCKTLTISEGWCCAGQCAAPQALDGPCDSYCQCHQNFACTDTGIGKKCKLKKGQTCTLSTDCTSGVCLSNGQCDQAAVGTSCKITAGIEGSVCGNAWAWDTCCAKICDAGTTQCAMTCTEGNTCYEGAGNQGECCTSTCITAPEKGGLNAPCGKDCVCDQNSFTCIDTYGGPNVDTCKKLNGQVCESGRDCASKVCVDGTCGTCMGMLAKTPCSTDVLAQGWCCNNQCIYAKPINSQCQRDCECNVGMECHNGLCKLAAGETCTSAALCASGQCVSSGIYTCGTCAVDGVGCLDENGVLKQCCSSLCNVGWKGVTEPCGNDCECATNMKCAGNPRTCKYVNGQPCTHGNQCQSGYCVDKTGNNGWRCGTCDAAEDNGNKIIDTQGATGICCVGNHCTPICRDSDVNGQVDACNSCEGMARGSLCYTVAGEGECCNNKCYTSKLSSGQSCQKDCECEAGFCDRNTHLCTDLAGEGALCISDADCQSGLTCIDTDGNGRLDKCSTCNKHGSKKCQEDILSGYCCGGTCKGMLYLSWFPEAECGENPCDGQVKCIAGDWKCNTAGQYKCFQDQSSTCTQTGIFNTGQAAKCVPYKCDGTTGKCRTACVSNDHCLISYSCIDLTTDGVPEACDTCTGHEASVCDLGGKTGFCCGDACKAPPVLEWTPANRCGEQDCNGAVKCEDGSWVCDTYGNPVCSPDLTLRGQCSNVGAFSSLGDCAPYTCDPSLGQCRTACASSVDCQTQFPCIDIDGQTGLDRCASCSAFGAAACEHQGTSGYCCGNGCESMSSDQWNPGGGCGLNQCDGGKVTCRESEWLCDTFERHVCNDGRTQTTQCSKLGEYDIPTEDSCGSYVCDPTVGTCMTGCSSDIHCTSQCCVLGSCVEKKTKAAGESCEKDCECGGNSVCDPGTKKCSKAVTCPNGQVRNCDASKPICVDDPLKEWLCKPECIPDEAPCVTETVRGFCCKGQCISPRPGFFPGKDCGRLDCGGNVGCNLATGELTCNSFSSICCDSNAPGTCNEVGDCQATNPPCGNQCGGGGSRTFLNYTCHTGLCEAVSSDCSEILFQCNPDRGCVECLDDTHCEDQCQRYSFLNYTCQNFKCEILGADIQDCSTGGSNQICQLPTGCLQCISTEQCQAQYGANYACDFQTLGCKVAKCFKDENCPYTCEQNIYRGQSCDNYVCRDKPEQDCKSEGGICTREGCVSCVSDVNCTLTYGTEFGCKAGRCEMLCGNGKCDEGEDCNDCPQDCQCKETETCDPTTTWPHGCAPDYDNDGFADDKDPCPRDPKNACKPCQGDKDCTDMCHQNAHIEFSCQISVCTPGTEVSCAEMGLICDPAARCVRCGNMTDSNKACKTAFEFTYICADDRCLPDRDMDGMPDSEDPCPTDPTNACTAECPNEVCEATEDCNTCPEDCGCDDGNPCSVDRCILGQCIYEGSDCGSACETGVCDGDSGCRVRSSGGGDCFCEGMCEKGYTCDHSQKCAKAECGDGKCQNECGQCPQDCSIKDCLNNGVCDTSMGENCAIAPKDCSCMPGFTCDTHRPESNEIGCYRVACGDTFCDSPDETAGTCCVDCECPGDQKCDPDTNSCRGGCGDGECELATECDSCRVDCTPDDCIDRKCAPGIGENCRNSADCICDAEIESESTVEMVEKQTKLLSFTVKNTGSLRDAFDITIESDPTFVGLAWTKRLKVNIDVNATFPLSVDVQGQIPGSHVLIINAVPRGLPNKTIVRKIVVAVEQESVLEQIGVLANIKDVIEVIVIIGALFLAVKRRFFPGKAVSIAAQGAWQQQQQQANYFGNQYYGGGGYYGQSGAWRAMPANNAQWGGQAGGWGQGQAAQAPVQQAAPPPKKEEPTEELSDAASGLHPGSVSGPSTVGKGLHPGSEGPTPEPKAKKTEEEEDLDYRGFHP